MTYQNEPFFLGKIKIDCKEWLKIDLCLTLSLICIHSLDKFIEKKTFNVWIQIQIPGWTGLANTNRSFHKALVVIWWSIWKGKPKPTLLIAYITICLIIYRSIHCILPPDMHLNVAWVWHHFLMTNLQGKKNTALARDA